MSHAVTSSQPCLSQELVGTGPDGVPDVVKQILAKAAASCDGDVAGSSVPQSQSMGTAEMSLHRLAPLGARAPVDASAVRRTGDFTVAMTPAASH